MRRVILDFRELSRYSEIGFDLDGTIYDIFELEIPIMEIIFDYVTSVSEISRNMFVQKYLTLMQKGCESRYDSLAEEFKLGWEARNKMIDLHRQFRPKLTTEGTLCELIFDLSRQGKRLFLVTNGSKERQESKILDLGLENIFKTIVFAGDHHQLFRKPSPAMATRLISQGGLELNRETIYIGDSDTDFWFARNLSINSMLFSNTDGPSGYRRLYRQMS